MIDEAIGVLTPITGSVRSACRAAGRPQANHYRRHRQTPAPARPDRAPKTQPRALTPAEREGVRALLNSPDFVDKAPATVYHELLDEGTYVASVSTMYRSEPGAAERFGFDMKVFEYIKPALKK